MAELKTRLIAARDTIALTTTGRLQPIRHYELMIGEFGPFTFEVEADQDAPDKLLDFIERTKKTLGAVGAGQ